MNEHVRKGFENRRKRAVQVWLKMWDMYSDESNPLTVKEIAKRVKKKNGQPYSRQYVHMAFTKLENLGLIERKNA